MATSLAFVVAHVARKPFHVDIVDGGKMSLQVALLIEFHCTQMAVVPYHVDIVDVGKMSLQSTVISKSFPAHCARVPLKFARFNNFRIGNFLDYGQVDRGR